MFFLPYKDQEINALGGKLIHLKTFCSICTREECAQICNKNVFVTINDIQNPFLANVSFEAIYQSSMMIE